MGHPKYLITRVHTVRLHSFYLSAMRKLKLSELVGIINKIAPPQLAEQWDNSGLQLGDPNSEISRIMVALEPTPDVIRSAIDESCQLLLTHHPLIFKPLKNISCSTVIGQQIFSAIRGNLAVMSIHTSFDIAPEGLNDLLARMIGLPECRPLKVTARRELVKLAVFVPSNHLDSLRSALLPFGAELGNYRDCSFSTPGMGTFTPLEGATPHIGTRGILEQVSEQRLELLLDRNDLARALKALLAAHPYEEPAFDIYPLLNEGSPLGLGRIGELPEPLPLSAYALQLKRQLAAPGLRYTGDPGRMIRRVALCSGSGASLLHDALRAGADLLVTGDVKYHEAREAIDLGLALIDAGHFPTEIIMSAAVADRLSAALASAGFTGCSVMTSRHETDPFTLCTN